MKLGNFFELGIILLYKVLCLRTFRFFMQLIWHLLLITIRFGLVVTNNVRTKNVFVAYYVPLFAYYI